mmetsp:Transcript_57626/g.134185  ORF Transcript_57626/g.134185 Transcript_57626/m.134185 type:complete len:219 (-) Transcript_57626:50-706(-)
MLYMPHFTGGSPSTSLCAPSHGCSVVCARSSTASFVQRMPCNTFHMPENCSSHTCRSLPEACTSVCASPEPLVISTANVACAAATRTCVSTSQASALARWRASSSASPGSATPGSRGARGAPMQASPAGFEPRELPTFFTSSAGTSASAVAVKRCCCLASRSASAGSILAVKRTPRLATCFSTMSELPSLAELRSTFSCCLANLAASCGSIRKVLAAG